MGVSSKVMEQGFVTIYIDTPGSILKDVVEYNRHAADCRRTMVHVNELKLGYCALNPLTVFAVCVAETETVFRRPSLAAAILIVYAAVFAFFVLRKGDLIISTAAAVLLPVLDLRFLVLLAADILLAFFFERLRRPLLSHPGYPDFFPISIRYENKKSPSA